MFSIKTLAKESYILSSIFSKTLILFSKTLGQKLFSQIIF